MKMWLRHRIWKVSIFYHLRNSIYDPLKQIRAPQSCLLLINTCVYIHSVNHVRIFDHSLLQIYFRGKAVMSFCSKTQWNFCDTLKGLFCWCKLIWIRTPLNQIQGSPLNLKQILCFSTSDFWYMCYYWNNFNFRSIYTVHAPCNERGFFLTPFHPISASSHRKALLDAVVSTWKWHLNFVFPSRTPWVRILQYSLPTTFRR